MYFKVEALLKGDPYIEALQVLPRLSHARLSWTAAWRSDALEKRKREGDERKEHEVEAISSETCADPGPGIKL